MLQRSVAKDCCGEVLEKSVVAKCCGEVLWRRHVEKCCREVLWWCGTAFVVVWSCFLVLYFCGCVWLRLYFGFWVCFCSCLEQYWEEMLEKSVAEKCWREVL